MMGEITPLRLCGMGGYEGRVNDVIYCPPQVRAQEDSAVIYFGGDGQDYPENMESNRENKNYCKWNLENMSLMLHSYFPESHILVVRPARLTTPKLATFMDFVSAEMDQNRVEFKTFSCYDNFVPCNSCGSPEHTPTHHTLQHLERLLQSVSTRLKSMPASQLKSHTQAASDSSSSSSPDSTSDSGGTSTTNNTPMSQDESPMELEDKDTTEFQKDNSLWWREGLQLDKANLILIGFSKGCVVLNQLIYEFHYLKTLTPDDDTMTKLVSRIRDMYWLDGGHSGGKNTWITSRSLLETLTRLSINIHVHVTPYQVQGERRPYIRKEEKAFCELLRRLGAPLERTLHFENQVATLLTHFKIHGVFRQPANQGSDCV